MPIFVDGPIRVMSQQEFGTVAYEVIRHAFAVHADMGRLFDEQVYQNELCRRLAGRGVSEAKVIVSFQEFQTILRMDLVVDQGAIFEIKTALDFHDQHRQQLIQYLMLTGLHHGKLINFRPEQVQHEFVNSSVTLAERQAFEVESHGWDRSLPGCQTFEELITSGLRDWGTGLDLQLYEQLVIHFLGGQVAVEHEIDVVSGGQRLGSHLARMINPVTAYKLTSIQRDLKAFESHLRRFIEYTTLEHLLWVNITLQKVLFVLISRQGDRKRF